jgi:hypothetical protein
LEHTKKQDFRGIYRPVHMCTITNPLILALSHPPFQMSCILSKNEFWFHVIPCLVTVKPYNDEFLRRLLGKIPSQTLTKSTVAAARGGDDDTSVVGAFTIYNTALQLHEEGVVLS